MTTAPLDHVLTVDLHVHDGVCALRLCGELDGLSCPQLVPLLDRALATAAATTVVTVVVDLRHVTFCDLDGLRALGAAHRRALARGVDLRCEGASSLLHRVAPVAGFAELFAEPG
ncbi:STAS domain-containing protein [Kineococcus sp. LSe6-4]|uniref:STAS domain-containing protein n=1 Tax=Kineococcus halophytocola TaxID=3234027 RepID=A0ABV4H6S9_9ACTN